MKKVIAVMIMALALLAGCGDGNGGKPPVTEPPMVQNTVGFSCASVNNDSICTGIETSPGIWYSGTIITTGSPMPKDYINLEVTNNLDISATIFAYSLVTINGCGDNPIAFDAVILAPGESVEYSYQLWNYICGNLGYQDTSITLYNAAGFDPLSYPNPWAYPRTDVIGNITVTWENIIL